MFLEINNLKKSFGTGESRVEVLKGIQFSVEKGEICVLLGPSGSGKSTLLNIIGGIDEADSGSIVIEGEKIEDMNEKTLTRYRRKHLGYVFQMYNLIPNLTVKENMEVGAYLSNHPLDINNLLKTLGLYDHRDKLPNQLSGGVILMLTAGCAKGTEKEQTAGTTSGKALAEMNDIPADGIITKEQFQSVAGKEQKVQFKGTTEDGITYVWTYDCAKIQNPEDQNLKIDFTQENLEEIKKQANDANDALQMTMHGKGVICVPTLEVTLPQSWESNAAYLVKEQDGKLAKMSDVTVTNDKESTTLVMTVTSLDGDCYVIGGVTEEQNKGADAANQSSKKKDGKEQSQETQEESENGTDSADADVSDASISATEHLRQLKSTTRLRCFRCFPPKNAAFRWFCLILRMNPIFIPAR